MRIQISEYEEKKKKKGSANMADPFFFDLFRIILNKKQYTIQH